jgi:hypothetical protein
MSLLLFDVILTAVKDLSSPREILRGACPEPPCEGAQNDRANP